ncbi:MAG: hypothetical protein AB7G37_13795 [Solirubrobacteraceae bacterium]
MRPDRSPEPGEEQPTAPPEGVIPDEEDASPDGSATEPMAEDDVDPDTTDPAGGDSGNPSTAGAADTATVPSGGPTVDPPSRLCRRCSAVTATSGEFCPHCGARYARRGRPWAGWSRRTRRIVVGVVVVVLLGGGGTAVALDVRADRAAERRAEERAAAEKRRVDAERKAQAAREEE